MSQEARMDAPQGSEWLREENERLRAAIAELRNRLIEPEEIVRAVRQGEVDAFVISEPEGAQIYSLRSAEQLYRSMVEEMQEGAVALDASGLIVYCNRYFADLLKSERASLLGASIFGHVAEGSRPFF